MDPGKGSHFLDMKYFAHSEPLWKGLGKLLKCFAVNLSPIFAQRDLRPFPRVTTLGGRKQSDFLGPTGYWFSIDPGFGRLQETFGPLIKVGAFRRRVINGVLDEVQLIVGQVCLQTHPVFISPVPE